MKCAGFYVTSKPQIWSMYPDCLVPNQQAVLPPPWIDEGVQGPRGSEVPGKGLTKKNGDRNLVLEIVTRLSSPFIAKCSLSVWVSDPDHSFPAF